MSFRCLFYARRVESLGQFECFLEKTFCVKVVSMASLTNRLRILADSFMSLGGITSMSLPFFISRYLKRFSISISVIVLK